MAHSECFLEFKRKYPREAELVSLFYLGQTCELVAKNNKTSPQQVHDAVVLWWAYEKEWYSTRKNPPILRDWLIMQGWVTGLAEVRRYIYAGAIKINGRTARSTDQRLKFGQTIKLGKHKEGVVE